MLSKTFNDEIIKEKLDNELYKKYKYYRNNYLDFDDELLVKYIELLKEYACVNNCRYYALISISLDNRLIYKKESLFNNNDIKLDKSNLFNNEIDVSNLECGSLRNDYKVKGLISIDTNSTPFINEDTLYIPSFIKLTNNESLDNKTPLIKSIRELNKVLKELFLKLNQKYEYIIPNLEIDQELYLIKDNEYLNNIDYIKLNHHILSLDIYNQKTYLSAFKYIENKLFHELINELDNLKINVKSLNLNVSQNQYKITTQNQRQNTALEQNKYLQNILENIAKKNKYKAILDEKPFLELNGSTKCNNYFLLTNKDSLLSINNRHYLLIISAFILAVDKYSPLLRLSSSSFTNERRLESEKSSPYFITLSLSEEIEKYLNNPRAFKNNNLIIENNKTSLITFLDNKIEFRLLGSSIDSTFFNICLNTMLIEAFKEISLRLNKEKEEDIIKDIYLKHKKIIYNDNNYTEIYFKEVNKRKLPRLDDYYKSLDYLIKYRDIFSKNKIMNHNEIEARYEIYKKQYIDSYQREYEVVYEIISKEILPYLEKRLINISKINKEYLSEYLMDKIEIIKQLSDKLYKLKIKIQELLKDIQIKSNLDLKYERLIKDNLIKEVRECHKKIKEYIE